MHQLSLIGEKRDSKLELRYDFEVTYLYIYRDRLKQS